MQESKIWRYWPDADDALVQPDMNIIREYGFYEMGSDMSEVAAAAEELFGHSLDEEEKEILLKSVNHEWYERFDRCFKAAQVDAGIDGDSLICGYDNVGFYMLPTQCLCPMSAVRANPDILEQAVSRCLEPNRLATVAKTVRQHEGEHCSLVVEFTNGNEPIFIHYSGIPVLTGERTLVYDGRKFVEPKEYMDFMNAAFPTVVADLASSDDISESRAACLIDIMPVMRADDKTSINAVIDPGWSDDDDD